MVFSSLDRLLNCHSRSYSWSSSSQYSRFLDDTSATATITKDQLLLLLLLQKDFPSRRVQSIISTSIIDTTTPYE